MGRKKLIGYFILLCFIGLITSVFVYPIFHECGHLIAALLTGGDVKHFTLYPFPSVLCFVNANSLIKQVIVALSGNLLPIALSLMFTPRHFYFWYANLILRIVNIYCLLLDFLYMGLLFASSPIQKNDITIILSLAPGKTTIISILILYTLCLCLLFHKIIKMSPVTTVLAHFDKIVKQET